MSNNHKLFTIFLNKAQAVHGGRYTYDNAKYTDSVSKIAITCSKHGDFYQTPASHIRGNGCPKCGFELSGAASSDDQNSFLEKAKQRHGDTYLYDKVNYENSLTPVVITCKVHGDFEQIPSSHIRGRGCQLCGYARASSVKTYQTDEFIAKLKTMYGDKWDYSQTVYNGYSSKVKLICPEHGEFYKNPGDMTSTRLSGCPECCRKNTPYTTEEFVKRATEIHQGKYRYEKTKYVDCFKKITIECPKHGEFDQRPTAHLVQKTGCPTCVTSNGENLIAKILKKHEIPFKQQFIFTGNYNKYRYDFLLTTHRVLIEFHGEQHFRPIDYFGGQEGFKKIRHNDKAKIKLAKIQKIPLIELNYTHLFLSEEEFEKLLVETLRSVNWSRKPYTKIKSAPVPRKNTRQRALKSDNEGTD